MVCVIFDFFKSNCRVTGAPEKKSILKYPSEVCATSQNVHGGAVLSRCGDFGSQGCDFTPLWHVIGQFKTQVLDSSGRSLLLSVRTQSEKKSHSLSTHEWVIREKYLADISVAVQNAKLIAIIRGTAAWKSGKMYCSIDDQDNYKPVNHQLAHETHLRSS
ncbi:uncharacterized protein LOC121891219 isoform X6 [Thunnus maccoyii]|uniref:uncharacterized protein LOC121891219 isoform X6 n=1 Tax=Thunnus maccoyii TaxID=8240 RepID=UPI001C4B6697|nr:uncharacterized protein LOC121891219 isoform X6 [Thunnus maccoyii]